MTTYQCSSLEVVCPEKPHLDITFSGDATLLYLSPHGLFDGTGIFVSPVTDIGYVTNLQDIEWEVSLFGDSDVDVFVRIHPYAAPEYSQSGILWNSGDLPYENDAMWGDNGLTWTEVSQHDISTVSGDCRFLQYKLIFTPGGL